MVKKVLDDRTAVKTKKDGTWPWSYWAPTKDQAHSGYLSAGNDYGQAVKNPVGTEKASGLDKGPIPQQTGCFSPEVIFGKEDRRG